MFDRSKRETSKEGDTYATFEDRQAAKTPEPRSQVREAAVIGPSIQINGDLSGEENLIIQGKVTGTIQLKEKRLTVGTQGKVDANVLAKSVIVEGEVKGDLYGSERVAIRNTGNVHGNIVSPKVSLEEGCRFKGSIDMDQEMIDKSFGKSSAASSMTKPEPPSSNSKAAEIAKQPKIDKPASGSGKVKTGSAG
ncbi:MAG: polymer-forming cytoskeletal protein [Candidatus Thiodiazotropha sp.]|jgi:cytoskeletal protein CcmA (bactofilin family)